MHSKFWKYLTWICATISSLVFLGILIAFLCFGIFAHIWFPFILYIIVLAVLVTELDVAQFIFGGNRNERTIKTDKEKGRK